MTRVPFVYNDPQHWQERAREARLIADRMTDMPSRANMLAVAEQYEKIAARAVDRLKANAKEAASLAKGEA